LLESRPPEIALTVALDRSSYVPYYDQIIIQLRYAIRSGKLREGEVFWSQRELAEKLGISVLPVKRAFERLRSEGLLVTAKGKHPVIGSGGVSWNVQDLWSFTEEIKNRGLASSTRLLSLTLNSANAEVSAALQLNAGDQVYCMIRLRSVQAEPVALETTHLPAARFPGLEKHDWGQKSLYSVIEDVYGYRLDRGEELIGAVKADHEEAHLLEVEVGFPLLTARRTVYDTDDCYGIRVVVIPSRSLCSPDSRSPTTTLTKARSHFQFERSAVYVYRSSGEKRP